MTLEPLARFLNSRSHEIRLKNEHSTMVSLRGLLGTHHLLLIAHLPNLLYIKISLGKIILSKIGFNYLKEKDLLYNIAFLIIRF